MNHSHKFTKKLTRRRFVNALLGGAGAALATSVVAAPSVSAMGFSTAQTNQPARMAVWTGWNEQAVQKLAQILEGEKHAPTAVSHRHVVVADETAQAMLANIVAQKAYKDEYYISTARADTQPTSSEEAAQIVHNLSIWKVNSPTRSVEKVYSRSFRDAVLVNSAIQRSAAPLCCPSHKMERHAHSLFIANPQSIM